MGRMEMDPHTFQQIVRRIEQQMRCPQCGKRMPVNFPSVRMAADDFFLIQLKCDTCDAHIVLNASLQNVGHLRPAASESRQCVNASSNLQAKDEELKALRAALGRFDEFSAGRDGGSFERMFKKEEPTTGTDMQTA